MKNLFVTECYKERKFKKKGKTRRYYETNSIERDLYFPKDINLADAIKREGFKVPNFLLNEDEETEI